MLGDSYNGRLMTGYRANSDMTNWCYFDGKNCIDTETNTPIGVHIDSNNAWVQADSSEPDCTNSMFASAINNALQKEINNIPLVPSNPNDCLVFDLAQEQMVIFLEKAFFCIFGRLQPIVIHLRPMRSFVRGKLGIAH